MEIDNSLHQPFDKPLSEMRSESKHPLLGLAKLLVAHNRLITKDGQNLPAAAAANTIALQQLCDQV